MRYQDCQPCLGLLVSCFEEGFPSWCFSIWFVFGGWGLSVFYRLSLVGIWVLSGPLFSDSLIKIMVSIVVERLDYSSCRVLV